MTTLHINSFGVAYVLVLVISILNNSGFIPRISIVTLLLPIILCPLSPFPDSESTFGVMSNLKFHLDRFSYVCRSDPFRIEYSLFLSDCHLCWTKQLSSSVHLNVYKSSSRLLGRVSEHIQTRSSLFFRDKCR